MKKLISSFLILGLVISIFCPTTLLAQDIPQEQSTFTLLSESAPYSLENYALQDLEYLVQEDATIRNKAISTVQVGAPLSIYQVNSQGDLEIINAFNYPVISSNQIISLLTILTEKQPNGEYLWSYGSQDLANALNETINEAELENFSESILVYNGEELLLCDASGNKKLVKLYSGSANNSISDSELTILVQELLTTNNYTKINPLTAASDNYEITLQNSITPYATQNYLTGFKPLLQGTGKPWCAQSATASIVNYLKGKSLTAKDVTIAVHGSSSVMRGLTDAQVINYAKTQGLSPSLYNDMSWADYKKHIDQRDPLYVRTYRPPYDDNPNFPNEGYHALVLIGYEEASGGKKIVSLTNQWTTTVQKQNFFDNMMSDFIWISSTGLGYSWQKSIMYW